MSNNRKALLVIDMQVMPFIWKDYGGKEVYKSEQLLNNINELIKKARTTGSQVFYIMHTEKGDSPRSEGAELWNVHPDINQEKQDITVIKYYADSFYETDLEEQLSELGIKELVICGLQTEFCIDTVCRSAHSKGYKVELVQDAHSTFDSDLLKADTIINHHNSILEQFCTIKPTNQIEL